jgi:hypothetical protein
MRGAPARARRRDAGDHRPDDGGGTGPARGGGLIALLAPGGERIARLVNGAGALTSLALVVGLGLWGYRLAVRDVQGIPVIRALAGAARVAPADPGGDLADHLVVALQHRERPFRRLRNQSARCHAVRLLNNSRNTG